MVLNDDLGESTPLLDDGRTKARAIDDRFGSTISLYKNSKSAQYPTAVYFVLLSKFFESFAANGIRSVLALYLRDSLHFAEDFSTATLHIFNFFGQFCPIFGAVLADSYIGNVSTIFHCMFPYAAGWIGMVAVALIMPAGGSYAFLLFVSLVLVAIGNGSIRACISALGGSQFELPMQADALQRYFSQYYFIYYGGILLSKIVPPAVRVSTQCLGRSDCYAAVFGMLAVVFFLCWAMFLCGLPYYRSEQPFSKENILGKVTGCMWHGIRRRPTKHPDPTTTDLLGKRSRWIDGAIGAYSEEFVDDVWDYLKVVVLFLPLPVYFALLVQQDSTWTFQATQLNTHVFGVKIEADQAKAIGPVFMLIMIPVWENICLPMLKSVANIDISPLRSITLGGLCAAFSFLCAAILQLHIENDAADSAADAAAAASIARLMLSNNGTTTTTNMALEFAVTVATTTVPVDVYMYTPNISILWQMPQFFLLMMGEVLLSIPGLQFAFTEAPNSMKSVLAATWFLNNATGNLIVVILTELHYFRSPSCEFVVYTFLMFASVLAFVGLSSRYEYRADRQRRKLLASQNMFA